MFLKEMRHPSCLPSASDEFFLPMETIILDQQCSMAQKMPGDKLELLYNITFRAMDLSFGKIVRMYT